MEMGSVRPSVRPDVVNAISREQYDGLRPDFTSGLVWTVPRMSSSRAHFAHINELCCYLIGRYCLCTISKHFHYQLSIVHMAGASGYLRSCIS
jgi:hypothetical protein